MSHDTAFSHTTHGHMSHDTANTIHTTCGHMSHDTAFSHTTLRSVTRHCIQSRDTWSHVTHHCTQHCTQYCTQHCTQYCMVTCHTTLRSVTRHCIQSRDTWSHVTRHCVQSHIIAHSHATHGHMSHNNAWSHVTQQCMVTCHTTMHGHIAHNIHSFIHSLISMRLQISPYLFSFLQHLKREIFNNIQLISLMKSGFGHATLLTQYTRHRATTQDM
jgi:hypothetical protein